MSKVLDMAEEENFKLIVQVYNSLQQDFCNVLDRLSEVERDRDTFIELLETLADADDAATVAEVATVLRKHGMGTTCAEANIYRPSALLNDIKKALN